MTTNDMLLIFPNGRRLGEFALSGSVVSTSGYLPLSGGTLTGLLKVSYDNATVTIDHNNTTEGATLNFNRQGNRKAFVDLDTSDNLVINLPTGKSFKIVVG